MFSQDAIALAAQRNAAVSSSPTKVTLIGSHASVYATEDSDVDLVVLQKEFFSNDQQYLRLIGEVHKVMTRVDLILMREEDFQSPGLAGGTLPCRAKKEGRVLRGSKVEIEMPFGNAIFNRLTPYAVKPRCVPERDELLDAGI